MNQAFDSGFEVPFRDLLFGVGCLDGSLGEAGCSSMFFLLSSISYTSKLVFQLLFIRSFYLHPTLLPAALVGIYTHLRSSIVVHEVKSATLVIESAAQRSIPVIPSSTTIMLY
jgi:hypothetical protein